MTRSLLLAAASSVVLALSPLSAHAGIATTPSTSWNLNTGLDPNFVGSMSGVGDLNGDGFGDVAWGLGGTVGDGQVSVLYGSPTGFHQGPPVGDWFWDENSAYFTVRSEVGASISAGDVNGDGYDDLVVGAPAFPNDPFGTVGSGAVLIWLGRSNFGPTGRNPDVIIDASQGPLVSLALARFGAAVAASADVDGDGRADIVVGAPGWLDGAGNKGRVFVFRGSATFGTGPAPNPSSAAWSAQGDTSASGFGSTLDCGDLTGDGRAEVAVGAPSYSAPLANGGAVFVWRGQSPLSAKPTGTLLNAEGALLGDVPGAQLGTQVSFVGDVNGDGYGELTATRTASATEGVELRSGGSGLTLDLLQQFGSTVGPMSARAAGDVNGDGLADLVVGDGVGPTGAPKIGLYYGRRSPQPLSATPDALLQNGVLTGGGAFVFPGVKVPTGIGDVNGDGYGDVGAMVDLQGAPPVSPGAFQILSFHGFGDATTSALGYASYGGQAGAIYGIGLGPAGDLNGDGYGDYVVGAANYVDATSGELRGKVFPVYGGSCGPACGPTYAVPANAWLGDQADDAQGGAVSGAGDLNGDGYTDVVVGAPWYDTPSGVDSGRMQIYLGGPSGLSTAPSFTFLGTDAGGQLGLEVAPAGDVNRDGLADVLISAALANNGSIPQAGKVLLFLGAPTPAGVQTTPAWSYVGTTAFERVGSAIASAGDFNQDSYSDVVVGTVNGGPGGEVAALVFPGGQPGGSLTLTPSTVLIGDPGGEDFNAIALSSGDVNGDGYSDVAMGEAEWSGPLGAYQGKVLIFRGVVGGIQSLPSTEIDGPAGYDRFGSNVGGGGDVNGDGYGDLVVGAQWRTEQAFPDGRAHVYLGGPSGLSTTEAVEFTDTLGDNSDFGRDVFLNLDVNGDGFSDVIASGYRTNEDEGAVFVHFGGGGLGMARHPRMRHGAGGTTPLALLGAVNTGELGAFNVTSVLRSAAGAVRVRAELETKDLVAPFDGTGTTLLAAVQTAPGGTEAAVGSSCIFEGGCRWRLRLRTSDPRFPHTPWFSPPGNTNTEVDLRELFDADGDYVSDAADNCPAVANSLQEDGDADLRGDVCDDCPTLANANQADADADGVGDVCDNCTNIANARVGGTYLQTNPWATLTGGQRDDDHDGFGNKCDAKFPGVGGPLVGPPDLAQLRVSNGHSRAGDNCGTLGTRPCAIFDLDEAGPLIAPGDLAQFRLLNGKAPGPKCATCPLPCAAGTTGTCF